MCELPRRECRSGALQSATVVSHAAKIVKRDVAAQTRSVSEGQAVGVFENESLADASGYDD